MNNKRQTVWLVSMLSLMVILSAYYLFTEDSGPINAPVADSQQVDGIKQGEAKETAGILDPTEGLVVNEVVSSGEVESDPSAAGAVQEPAATEGKEAGNTEKTPAAEPGENNGEAGKETDKGATTTPETDGQAGALQPRLMRKSSRKWKSRIRQHLRVASSRTINGSVKRATIASMKN